MIIYRENFISNKGKSELNKALTERLISKEDSNKLYIFPFDLFLLNFWKDFRRSMRVLFSGKNTGQTFELETERLIFSNRTNLPLTITGSLEENKINLTYSIPVYAILLIVGFTLIVYFLGKRLENEFETLPFVMGILFVLMYIIKVLRIHYAFKRICN